MICYLDLLVAPHEQLHEQPMVQDDPPGAIIRPWLFGNIVWVGMKLKFLNSAEAVVFNCILISSYMNFKLHLNID